MISVTTRVLPLMYEAWDPGKDFGGPAMDEDKNRPVGAPGENLSAGFYPPAGPDVGRGPDGIPTGPQTSNGPDTRGIADGRGTAFGGGPDVQPPMQVQTAQGSPSLAPLVPQVKFMPDQFTS